jgi:hypothetical protein
MVKSPFFGTLQALCQGLGVQDDERLSKQSDALRRAFGVESNDLEEVRQAISQRLNGLINTHISTPYLQLIARVSFNIADEFPEIREENLTNRLTWLADLAVFAGTVKKKGFSYRTLRAHKDEDILPVLAAALERQKKTRQPVDRRSKRSRRGIIISALTALAVVLVGGVLILFVVDHGPKAPESNPKSTPPTTKAASGSRIPGDSSEFYGGSGPPDGKPFPRNKSFTETWRIRNTGSVAWYGRYLVRQGPPQDSGDCRSKERVQVPDTMPGQVADITVRVTSPSTPTHCRVYWKMADAQGRLYFPNKEAVLFDLIIE